MPDEMQLSRREATRHGERQRSRPSIEQGCRIPPVLEIF